MTPLSATLQKPTPHPDREVTASQPEADVPNAPDTGAKRGFSDALRAASGRSSTARAGSTNGGEAAEPDGSAEPAEPAPAGPGSPAAAGAPMAAADPANAAMAILATILNVAAPTIAAEAGPTRGADDRTGAAGSITDGAATGGVLRADAAGLAAGPGARALAEAGLGLTNTVTTGVAQPGAAAPSGLPKVAVLDSTVHFKPVLPNAVPRNPALATRAAATAADPGGAKAPLLQAGLSDPTAAKAQPDRVASLELAGASKASTQSTLSNQSQPTSESAGAATRAAGAGLEKADVQALADIRAVTGSARAGLATTGRPEAGEASSPDGLAGASLPAGTLPTIASAIRDELDRASASESASRASPADQASRASQADQASRTAPDGPLRVLRIQLKPDDLGTVTVELRLANGQLETHLRASQPETAALLHRDAAILTDLLRQSNYQADVTVTQARPTDTGGFSGGSASQGQPGFSEGGARSGQGEGRQRQADPDRAAGRREGERGNEALRPRDGGIYL